MVKKAQISFIAITMSILLVIFGVIYAITFSIMRNINELSIERTLDEAELSYKTNGEDVIFRKGIISVVVYNHFTNSYSYKFTFDSDAFSNEEATKIIEDALSSSLYSGKFSNIYYKILSLDDTQTKFILVAGDMSESIEVFRSQVVKAFLLMLFLYLALFYIVFRLSFIVFKPIKDSLAKQKQFISNASHELKTPLTIISANVDVLDKSENNQWAKNIKSQTERMNILVGDMLTLARMDEGDNKLIMTEFNLSEETTNVALSFDALAFEKGKTLELDIMENIKITANKESFRNILNILLDNAVKHASENGVIKVSLKKESTKIALSVYNSGSLVPNMDSNKVFERFYRADQSRSHESGGSGLGLSIARSIAQSNKWKISAQSDYAKSMTITVVFK